MMQQISNDKFFPKKKFGQHFLWDNNIAKKIVSLLNVFDGDFVLEIGFGKGILTQHLLQKSIHYLGVEIDNQLFVEVLNNLPKNSNAQIQLLNQDFLDLNLVEIYSMINRKMNIIGNIPYNLTSPILFRLMENCFYLKKAVLMVQKEVAQRLVGSPKTKEYGILSVLLSAVSEVKKKFDVAPSCFFPKPKVASSVLEIVFQNNFDMDAETIDSLKQIVKSAFSRRRKILRNTLFIEYPLALEQMSYPEIDFFESIQTKRAEELSVMDYLQILKLFKKRQAK